MLSLSNKLLACVCLLLAVPSSAHAASAKTRGPKTGGAETAVPAAERYARRCQPDEPRLRGHTTQGTLLWGTKQGWRPRPATNEATSVLASANLDAPPRAPEGVKALRVEGGHLTASMDAAAVKGALAPESSLAGTVLRGAGSDGQPVEVALCGAEPSPEDPGMVWYRVEVWNPVVQDWENPCVATGQVPQPRALAMSGVWDSEGAHHDVAGKITFACENGVIAKCARWGYKPWASRNGQPLADLHQACTRMARADYCGNGRSHTQENTMIDYYDSAGVSSRTTEVSEAWDPARGSFEAAWAPDGAVCLGRTRDGHALSTLFKECPGRFQTGAVDLGDGDLCKAVRPDVNAKTAPLRNRSYGGQRHTAGRQP